MTERGWKRHDDAVEHFDRFPSERYIYPLTEEQKARIEEVLMRVLER